MCNLFLNEPFQGVRQPHAGRVDSVRTQPTLPVPAPVHRTRARIAQRALEIVPGLVSWLLILSPLLLSFRFPAIVALFVLTFDFYWLYKAVVLTGPLRLTVWPVSPSSRQNGFS